MSLGADDLAVEDVAASEEESASGDKPELIWSSVATRGSRLSVAGSISRRSTLRHEGPKQRVRVSTVPLGAPEQAQLDEMVRSIETGSSVPGTSLPDAQTLREDVGILNKRLSSMNAFLLSPTSKMMQYWDFATLSALAFTATVTPYEVCMMVGESTIDPLFAINQFINVIFIIDIGFNFFLPFREPISKGGGTVKNHKRIVAHYLKGWLSIDVCSVFPVDVLMVTGVLGSEDASGSDATQMLQMVRMLRLLRLIKLARILRASRIFSRWENSISLTYPQRSLITWTVSIAVCVAAAPLALHLAPARLLPTHRCDARTTPEHDSPQRSAGPAISHWQMVLHWMACSLGLLAQLHPSLRTAEMTEQVAALVESDRQGMTAPGDECVPGGARTRGIVIHAGDCMALPAARSPPVTAPRGDTPLHCRHSWSARPRTQGLDAHAELRLRVPPLRRLPSQVLWLHVRRYAGHGPILRVPLHHAMRVQRALSAPAAKRLPRGAQCSPDVPEQAGELDLPIQWGRYRALTTAPRSGLGFCHVRITHSA